MNTADLQARVNRLDELVMGLCKERLLIREGDDPLHFVERRDYLSVINAAIDALQSARRVLVMACQRLGEEDGKGPKGAPEGDG